MKKNLSLRLFLALLLAAAPMASKATVFFTDNFSAGSTTNGPSVPGGTPAASFTSYDIASSKTTCTNTAASAGHFQVGVPVTSSGGWEVQALFTTNAIALTFPNDFIQLTVVFTDVNGLMGSGATSAGSGVWMGLFNSGTPQNLPVAGALEAGGLSTAAGSPFATGNCANWTGYACQILNNASVSRILTRPPQADPTIISANQDLLGANVGSGFYRSPAAVVVGTNTMASSLVNGSQYTMVMTITLTNNTPNALLITNTLYSGVGTLGTVLYSSSTTTNLTGSTLLTSGFDGLAIGAYSKGTPNFAAVMDINSIQITGISTPVTGPPHIDTQPISATVPSGGSCAFSVAATGFNVSYQWHRHGTNLIDGPNISGSTSSMLVVSPAGAADVAVANANGYYVTVTGTGPFSTNSITNSLTLGTANTLTWSGNSSLWDLNTTPSWLTNGTAGAYFNYGDSVIFDNYAADFGGGIMTVSLAGSYLSAASVTVNAPGGYDYTISGTGSFTGPGTLLYSGQGHLTMNSANSYTGGTTISNAGAFLVLNNYNALGTGPVTLAKAGGQMEIIPPGSASLGINGDVNVADDFTITYLATNSFGAVLFGDLSGTSGKTLTINHSAGGTPYARIRIYGPNTVYNGNLNLNNSQVQWAFYQNAGESQVYNGFISGSGNVIQRGNGATVLNNLNTYTGGTTPSAGLIGFGIDSTPTTGTVTAGPIGTGPLTIAPEVPNTTGSGQVFASGGARTIGNAILYPSGTNNQTLLVGGTNALTFTAAINLAGADGITTNTITTRFFQVTNTALTTLSGVISDATNGVSAGYGLAQLGNGILVLNNTETYTGPTVVSNGTIQVNGALNAASVVTVATNGNLGGNGTIAGPVTIQLGGALAPGATLIGTLTINNNLSIAGNVKVRVNRTGPASDNASVSLTLANSGTGTVFVTNTGATFHAGDTFTLFNKAVTGGAGLKVIGGGVGWTNQLALNGTIKVTSTNLPTVIGTNSSATTVTLSWPVDYAGWVVQSNAVSLVSTTNWFTVPNSGSANSFVATINPAKTNGVYFRLIQPSP